jgi:hypothetical protein
MPYPESCPECSGPFRNTGTHFTARRNEVGRHVLLELGCQNTTRRFWWDFTTGSVTENGQTVSSRRAAVPATIVAATASRLHQGEHGHSTHGAPRSLSGDHQAEHTPTVEPVDVLLARADRVSLETTTRSLAATVLRAELLTPPAAPLAPARPSAPSPPAAEPTFELPEDTMHLAALPPTDATVAADDDADGDEDDDVVAEALTETPLVELAGAPPVAPHQLKEAFARQLQLDRLTLRQMRSWLMSEEARRAIEVAAGATEATYERLALILFGTDLPQLLGKQPTTPASAGLSAEERLELQREKARIRARLRRAAAKAARQQG